MRNLPSRWRRETQPDSRISPDLAHLVAVRIGASAARRRSRICRYTTHDLWLGHHACQLTGIFGSLRQSWES